MLYQLSPFWILRDDEYREDRYTLFNIHSAKEYILNPSVFSLLSALDNTPKSSESLAQIFNQSDINFVEVISNLNAQWNGLILEELSPSKSIKKEVLKIHTPPKSKLCSGPKSAEIHLTSLCNLECLHCLHSCDRKARKISLSGKEWIAVLKQLESYRVQRVVLTGGEVFTHPDIDEILEAVSMMKMRVVILTNAMLIASRHLKFLSHPHIILSISIDGCTAQTHDFLRGRGSFSVLNRKLSQLKNAGVNRILSVTLHAKNSQDVCSLVKFAINEGIRSINFTILDEVGRAKDNTILHMNAALRQECKTQIRALQKKHSSQIPIFLIDIEQGVKAENDIPVTKQTIIQCSGATSHIAIDEEGNVYPCVYAFEENSLCAGNLLSNNLKDIWNTTKWNLLRGGILMGELHQCIDCKLKDTCQTKNCRVRALKYNNDIYSAPTCIMSRTHLR